MTSKQTMTYAALSALCLVSNASFAKINDDIDLSGYIMLDYNKFDTSLLEGQYDSNSSESTSEIRRARLSFKSDISKDWKSKFQLGFADGETEIKDAYLEYSGWKYADLTIGQKKKVLA
ncbi:porin [Pseudoalteromonas sp. Hal099]